MSRLVCGWLWCWHIVRNDPYGGIHIDATADIECGDVVRRVSMFIFRYKLPQKRSFFEQSLRLNMNRVDALYQAQ